METELCVVVDGNRVILTVNSYIGACVTVGAEVAEGTEVEVCTDEGSVAIGTSGLVVTSIIVAGEVSIVVAMTTF